MDQQLPSAHPQHQNNRRITPLPATNPNQSQHPPPQPCPRCHSTNTKFCYYNNYSLSQPRYFCKGCRRYWTHGGTLRNVPVGGGCRKSKRPKIAAATTSATQPLIHHSNNQINTTISNNNNNNGNSSNNNNNNSLLLGTSPYYGGAASGGGFLSSLAAIQEVTQPLSFGPNLGLLHGMGLPSFDHHQVHQQQQPSVQQEPPSFQQLLQQRHDHNIFPGTEIGLVPTHATGGGDDWNLNNLNNDNNENNNNNSSQNQWPDFPRSSGLDDP